MKISLSVSAKPITKPKEGPSHSGPLFQQRSQDPCTEDAENNLRKDKIVKVLKNISVLLLFMFSFVPVTSTQNETIVFLGYPKVIIGNSPPEDGKTGCKTEYLASKDSIEYRCVIVKRGKRYYWSSREDKELKKTETGMFIVFTRVDGYTDYIKIVKPGLRELTGYGYMEHMTVLLSTITYFGSDITR